jgi:hypothetical protein
MALILACKEEENVIGNEKVVNLKTKEDLYSERFVDLVRNLYGHVPKDLLEILCDVVSTTMKEFPPYLSIRLNVKGVPVSDEIGTELERRVHEQVMKQVFGRIDAMGRALLMARLHGCLASHGYDEGGFKIC